MISYILAFSSVLGQTNVIIPIIAVVFMYPMLHTKFQGHWSVGSVEEDFKVFHLPCMGVVTILNM